MNSDMKRLASGDVNLLVGTPGRLNDLLDNSPLKGQLLRLSEFLVSRTVKRGD